MEPGRRPVSTPAAQTDPFAGAWRGKPKKTPCTHATVFYDVRDAVRVWRCGTGRHAVTGHVLNSRGFDTECAEGEGAIVATAGEADHAHPARTPEGYELRQGSWIVAIRRNTSSRKRAPKVPEGQLGFDGMPLADLGNPADNDVRRRA